ncbi:PAS domain-containing protein, partial [Streptomyces sp. NPDC050564]|uniref:PAS domain-containing protein n=1 Tax=Streptomyces sp. NPDC050564 TaxID=3365631 RepID=UPI0037874754
MERLPTPPGEQAQADAVPGSACTATARVNEQGIVTGWSEGARRLLGYVSSQIVGQRAARLLAGDGGGAGEAAWRDAAGRQRLSGTVVLRHQDGHLLQRPLLAHRQSSGGAGGAVAEWLVVCAVAGEPRTAGDQALSERVFRQSPCILAVFDADLRLVRANAGMEHALSLTEEQMRGLRLPDIAPHAVSQEAEAKMRRALESGEGQHMEAYIRPTGVSAEHGWSTSLAPLKDSDGRVRAVCLAAHHTLQEQLARQRMLLLNDASTRIGTTSDIRRTAQELADVAVPGLADFAAVDLLEIPQHPEAPATTTPTGHLTAHRVAVRSAADDTSAPPGMAQGPTRYPELSPVAQCLAQGHGALYEGNDPALVQWAATDPQAG